MQLQNLIKPIEEQTDEELLERLREIRNNRNTVRPAAKSHAKRAAKKGQQGRIKKVESLLEGLTPEQIEQLLTELGEG
jgi:hypothetical protein